ncbi:hypothetical protein E2C01_073651 [Portunus trituberculatus]|uniref:Uncharacterized protein n=1 Tax=Portunus trituberculatus TaxID=210409 RepID=A0A5B7IE35_PORTR|nr:hypothetical protein [Portunus trituberculatus]
MTTGVEPCNASVNEQQQYPEQTGVLHIPAEEKMRKLSEGWKQKEKQVTEDAIETKSEKLPGMLVMRRQALKCVYKFMDEDAITTLHAKLKTKEDDIPGHGYVKNVQESWEIIHFQRELAEYESVTVSVSLLTMVLQKQTAVVSWSLAASRVAVMLLSNCQGAVDWCVCRPRILGRIYGFNGQAGGID